MKLLKWGGLILGVVIVFVVLLWGTGGNGLYKYSLTPSKNDDPQVAAYRQICLNWLKKTFDSPPTDYTCKVFVDAYDFNQSYVTYYLPDNTEFTIRGDGKVLDKDGKVIAVTIPMNSTTTPVTVASSSSQIQK